MEGVLTPEIWIEFAKESGITELKRTTRDEPDYNKLMSWRLDILKKHSLGLEQIQQTIAKIKVLDGAKDFIDNLRDFAQVIILSDTFTQFAKPLMLQLGLPTIFCNDLVTTPTGQITGFKIRQQNGKYHAVQALKSINLDTIAVGDSFNDLEMIKHATKGFLFRTTEQIKKDNPQIQSFDSYADLLCAIKEQASKTKI